MALSKKRLASIVAQTKWRESPGFEAIVINDRGYLGVRLDGRVGFPSSRDVLYEPRQQEQKDVDNCREVADKINRWLEELGVRYGVR